MKLKELEKESTLRVNDMYLTERQYFVMENNEFFRCKVYLKDDTVIAVCTINSSLENDLYMDVDFALNPRLSILKEFICMRVGVPQRLVKLFDIRR